MRVMIDALNGAGSVDYSAYVQFGKTACIVRELNKPTICTLPLLALNGALPIPPILARVEVWNEESALLFTGYVNTVAAARINGEAEMQDSYLNVVSATSDEILLDAQQAIVAKTLLGQSSYQNWTALAALSAAQFEVTLLNGVASASRVEVEAGARWSGLAGAFANQTRGFYRCINGVLTAGVLGEVIHPIAADDPGLRLESVGVAGLPYLASDLTLYGQEEPTAYVTEVFAGDGMTSKFTFTEKPFSPTVRQKSSLTENFQGTSLNPLVWQIVDPGAHIALTAAGLTCNGGSGRDAEATVASVQQIELGGSLTAEADGVLIAAGSSGLVLGLYTGPINQGSCFAGFQVSSQGNTTSIAPLLNGESAGTALSLQAGHLYTFRLRIYSAEMERLRQNYFAQGESGPIVIGGDLVSSAGQVEFEVQDVTSGTPGAPLVLFCGAVSSLPSACVLGLLDSGSLVCSIRSAICTQGGPLWVTTGVSGSAPMPQFVATAANGGTCHITTTGELEFYSATIPSDGALIFVNYRAKGRSAARRVRIASGTQALPLNTVWAGTLRKPVPWSSMDCDAAVSAILESASADSTALKGDYTCNMLSGRSDMWPGDVLLIGPQQDGTSISLIARKVEVIPTSCKPDVLTYMVSLANDGAEAISIELAEELPLDAVLPQAPNSQTAKLVNMGGVSVTTVNSSSITIQVGMQAPINGGFEIRRRDNCFGPGTDGDLVMRSAVPNISIPRSSAMEQFYMRMYDGASPPNYSAFSAALFVNVPL